MAREVYQLESEGTYQVVLTLLLAEKEVKVLKRSLEDGISKQLASKKAILLIT